MSDPTRSLKVQICSGCLLAASDTTLATSLLENCTATRTSAGVYVLTIATGMAGNSAINNSKQARARLTSRTTSRIVTLTYGADDGPPAAPTKLHINAVDAAAAAADADLEFEVWVEIPA